MTLNAIKGHISSHSLKYFFFLNMVFYIKFDLFKTFSECQQFKILTFILMKNICPCFTQAMTVGGMLGSIHWNCNSDRPTNQKVRLYKCKYTNKTRARFVLTIFQYYFRLSIFKMFNTEDIQSLPCLICLLKKLNQKLISIFNVRHYQSKHSFLRRGITYFYILVLGINCSQLLVLSN